MATQNRFNTTSTGIGAVDVSDVSIFVNNRMLNVINQSHSYIRSIQILTVSGQMIKYIEVNASDNVFAFLGNISEQVLMVRVVWRKQLTHSEDKYVKDVFLRPRTWAVRKS